MLKASVCALSVAGLMALAACSSSDVPGDAGGIVNAAPCARATAPEAVGMPSTERIYGWIEDLVGIGYRRTGTVEGDKAAAYVKCQFESLGLQDVQYETVTSWKWHADRHALSVAGSPVDSFPTSHSFVTVDKPSTFSTGPGGLNAEVVDIGRGGKTAIALNDVKGKIVVFDLQFLVPPAIFAAQMEFFWDPKLSIIEPTLFKGNPFLTSYTSVAEALMKAGAAGFIGVLDDYFDSNQYHNEFYRRTQVTIPGVWITKKEGARMRQLIKDAKGTATANLVLEGSREEVTARTVVGFLHGKSKDTIMVQSHHDSVFFGAVEDGSGTAAVLAQAQYFASLPASERQKTLMFITFDTHFTGYQSHMEFVRKYITAKETPYNIVANVTLEHIGKQGTQDADGKLVITEQPELRAIIENLGITLKASLINSIIKHDLRRTAMVAGGALCLLGGLPTDASFVCTAGVPTASLIAGPNYLYDAADTLDKIAKDDLVPVTEVFIDLIKSIDKTPTALIGLPLL